MSNNNVYILSLEAVDIYNHMYREGCINYDYKGMIPDSLLLDKLRELGMDIKRKNKNKKVTLDIINVKFGLKVKNSNELSKENLKKIKKKLKTKSRDLEKYWTFLDKPTSDKLTGKSDIVEFERDYIDYLFDKNKRINEKSAINPLHWTEIKNEEVRNKFYTEGFKITHVPRDKSKEVEISYVPFQRSSAKSRKGEVLFINVKLVDDIKKWYRMGLEFDNRTDIDFPSLLSYESLIGSSKEDTVKISPDNILLIDDIEQAFAREANVVRLNDEGCLDSFRESTKIVSSLFDGQCLLESRYFPEGKSMILLRQHMFKSAAFNCNIQDWLKDYAIAHKIDFDSWQIENMLNQSMYAKDVHMIVCPSSLKALKFSKILNEKEKIHMWEHWKNKVFEDRNRFAICKTEKESKRGYDENGKILQQMSYQMVNSLPATRDDIEELAAYEKAYVENLKKDDDKFIEYLTKNVNDMNSYTVWIDLYERNHNIAKTEEFRKFKSKVISQYVKYIKGGKLRLPGDYCILCGNVIEMLYHAVRINVLSDDYIKNNLRLKDNQVYTKLFPFNKEYVAFRNPHTSPSNILPVHNIYVQEIDDYFNFNSNIVCVNAINFQLQRILSGCDYDTDSVVIFNHNKLLEIGKKAFDNYKVCINDVPRNDDAEYSINNKDWAKIDNILAKSQRNIGTVVNMGQNAMSKYWDLASIGRCETPRGVELLKIVDVCTVLSEICIDSAKRMYDIDLDKQIEYLQTKLEGRKPLFFKIVQGRKIKTISHECPMDYLHLILTDIKDMEPLTEDKRINFSDLLRKYDVKKRDRGQCLKLIKYIEELESQIKHIEGLYNGKTEETESQEKYNLIDDVKLHYEELISRFNRIKPETIYYLLTDKKTESIKIRFLGILSKTHKHIYSNVCKFLGNEKLM